MGAARKLDPLPDEDEMTGAQGVLDTSPLQDAEIVETGGLVARNASIYFVIQVASWVITVIGVSVVPRRLGERAWGQIAVAETVAFTLAATLGLGCETYLIKEVGRDRENASRLVRATLGLRILLFIPGATLSILAFIFLSGDSVLFRIGLCYTLAMGIQLVQGTLRAILSGWEEAGKVAIGDFIGSLPIVLVIPFLSYGPIAYVGAVVAVLIVTTLLRAYWIAQRASLRPTFEPELWRTLVLGGAPFLMNDVILRVYGVSSVFVVRHFCGDSGVGVLSQGSKLFGTFLFVPTAIGAALLPSISRLAHQDREAFSAMQARILALLVTIGLPVAALVFVLAKPVCVLLYSADRFQGLPLVLQVMSFAVIPVYVVTTIYQFLVVQNKGATWGVFLIGTVTLNTIFGFIAVPIALRLWHNGAAGAALANVGAEIASMVAAIALLHVNPFTREVMGRISRALAAAVGMAIVMWLVRDRFLLIPVGLGIGTFLFLGRVLHILDPDEQVRLGGLFGKLKSRLRV